MRERGQTLIWVGLMIVLVVLMTGCWRVCVWDDHESMTVTPAAYHDGGDDYDGGDYSSDDRNRNRDRNRGAFSPGPFDRSPVDIHDNQVCMPYAHCEPGRGEGRMGDDAPGSGRRFA